MIYDFEEHSLPQINFCQENALDQLLKALFVSLSKAFFPLFVVEN